MEEIQSLLNLNKLKGIDNIPLTHKELLQDISDVITYLGLENIFERFGETYSFIDNGIFVIITRKGLMTFRNDLYKRVEAVRLEILQNQEKEKDNAIVLNNWNELASKNLPSQNNEAVPIAPELLLLQKREQYKNITQQRKNVYDDDDYEHRAGRRRKRGSDRPNWREPSPDSSYDSFESESVEYGGYISDDFISDVEDFRFNG